MSNTNPNTQIAAPAQTSPAIKPPTIRQHLQSTAFTDAVRKALPKHLTADRFIRVALTAITRTPKLAQCDQASFFNCLLTLSQFGLEPDGRRAHLIPFANRKRGVVECQLIIDWKGLAELAMRSGIVANLHADVIREGDLLEFNAGKIAKHIPHFLRRDAAKPANAGDIFAAYATAEFKDGSTKSEALSIDEVNAIRGRSRAGNDGPWVSDFSEMAKKTAFRRLAKWLPLSAEFRDAVEVDDAIEVTATAETNQAKIAGGLVAALEAPAIPEAAPDEDVPYNATETASVPAQATEGAS